MRPIRTEADTPAVEKWEEQDVAAHLGCDIKTAETIMNECRQKNGLTGYGPIEKHLLLDFINEKQRAEREREDNHKAAIAQTEIVTTLREQVKVLQEQQKYLHGQLDAQKEVCRNLKVEAATSAIDARQTRTQTWIACAISFCSMIIALIALFLPKTI